MLTRPRHLFLLLVTSTVLAALTLLPSCSSFEPGPYPKKRRLLMEMRATLHALPPGIEQATIWMPTPLSDAQQTRGPLELSALGGEAQQRFDKLGNNIVSVTGTPTKSRPLEIYYRVELTRVERFAPKRLISNGTLKLDSPWLVPARRAVIPGLARQVLERTARIPTIDGRVLAIYDDTLDLLTLSAPPVNRLASSRYSEGVLAWIMKEHVGDSIDIATYFITHCQAARIPASFELGYRLPANEQLQAYEPRVLHAWARLDLPGLGWMPFDPAMAEEEPGKRKDCFGGLDSDRILISRGRDLTLNPPIEGEPLNFFGWPIARAGKLDLSSNLKVQIQIQDL
ncbi:MAG: hypothetical protein CSA62_13845 [Planctomycetota bacterium]|nr:MAG: hypothetical protein CSA62_13845 [Planctomycetota bacterium]